MAVVLSILPTTDPTSDRRQRPLTLTTTADTDNDHRRRRNCGGARSVSQSVSQSVSSVWCGVVWCGLVWLRLAWLWRRCTSLHCVALRCVALCWCVCVFLCVCNAGIRSEPWGDYGTKGVHRSLTAPTAAVSSSATLAGRHAGSPAASPLSLPRPEEAKLKQSVGLPACLPA